MNIKDELLKLQAVAQHIDKAEFAAKFTLIAEEFNRLQNLQQYDVSGSAHVMKGKLITYVGFTQSNRNHLTIEIWGEENYMGNVLKSGDELELRHYR